MSIGSEIAYRRRERGKDATGSLVFDAERRQARRETDGSQQPGRQPPAQKMMKRSEKKQIG